MMLDPSCWKTRPGRDPSKENLIHISPGCCSVRPWKGLQREREDEAKSKLSLQSLPILRDGRAEIMNHHTPSETESNLFRPAVERVQHSPEGERGHPMQQSEPVGSPYV
jgi:hypothetical protein